MMSMTETLIVTKLVVPLISRSMMRRMRLSVMMAMTPCTHGKPSLGCKSLTALWMMDMVATSATGPAEVSALVPHLKQTRLL